MSKPLTIVLQLAGLLFIVAGVEGYGRGDFTNLWVGLVLLVIGGIGIRKRFTKREVTNIPVAEVSSARETRECPFCAEEILLKAKLCKHCGSTVEQPN